MMILVSNPRKAEKRAVISAVVKGVLWAVLLIGAIMLTLLSII